MSTVPVIELEHIPPPPPAPAAARRPAAYKPLARLGSWLQSVILGSLLLQVAVLVVAPGSVDAVGRIEVTQSSVEALLIADIAVFVVVGLSSIVWCHRVAANVDGLGARGLTHSPAQAVYWWFVPIASLFKPFQVIREVAKASEPTYEPDSPRWQAARTPALLGWWWAAYLATEAWVRASFLLWGGDGELDTALTAASMATVVAHVLWFAVVHRITVHQRQRATRLARQGLLPAELAHFGRT